MGRTSYMNILSHGTTSSSTSLHMDAYSLKLAGETNGMVMKHTLLDTTPQKLIGYISNTTTILYGQDPVLGNNSNQMLPTDRTTWLLSNSTLLAQKPAAL